MITFNSVIEFVEDQIISSFDVEVMKTAAELLEPTICKITIGAFDNPYDEMSIVPEELEEKAVVNPFV
jgi:hypothetical protein